MSIVERALQKAQQKTRDAVPDPAAPSESVPEDSGNLDVPVPAAVEPVVERRRRGVVDLTNPVVHLDVQRLRAEGRLPSEEYVAQVDEEIRRIKWPLLEAIEGENPLLKARNNVILVTSAVPGEGKTFVSLNLALSIIRDRDMKVILVDGDVARPGLTPALGLQDRTGVNDLLIKHSMGVDEVIYPTNVSGLMFVPAGTWHEHSPELFSSDRMRGLAEALSQRADPGVVIIDSPPLLVATEAQAIGRNIGQIVMVVRADSTEQREVKEALELLDKTTPTYAVLNRVESSIASRYYGRYYYGYGNYRYGRESGKRGA